jgi:hypothetical protein
MYVMEYRKLLVFTVACLLVLTCVSPAMANNTLLKFGSRGDEVTRLQQLLADKGFLDHEATGYYGPLTTQAVIKFQRYYDLTVDGIAGPETFAKLSEALPLTDEEREAIEDIPDSGEYLDWFEEVQHIFGMDTVATVTDVDTGLSFDVMRTFGHEHADCETLTAQDTKIMKSIWDGWSWDRRAVIVTVGDRHIAASATAMPHAGSDKSPALKTISSRSGGYGKGTNLDKIKGNEMDGVICIHFKNSHLHKKEKTDPQHHILVKKAAGL